MLPRVSWLDVAMRRSFPHCCQAESLTYLLVDLGRLRVIGGVDAVLVLRGADLEAGDVWERLDVPDFLVLVQRCQRDVMETGERVLPDCILGSATLAGPRLQ